MKRLFTLLVVSVVLVCISPLDLFAPPGSVPPAPGPDFDFVPIDGFLVGLLVVGSTIGLYKRKNI